MREFSYEEIEAATDGFSLERLIGKGSHGRVYKGKLRDGRLVAVKKPSAHGESKLENEINILKSITNPCVVNLLGFCPCPTNCTKLLVMEFMPHGSLHDLIHLSPAPPSLRRRALISLQIAQAILSLHEAAPWPIIHRDIKSANVLVDSKRNARIGDFGLAIRDNGRPKEQSVMPAGTIGYIDPCYTEAGQLGLENDVYSLGVLLLEIVSSRKVMDMDCDPSYIVSWAVPLIKAHRFEDVCDNRVSSLARDRRLAVGRILQVAARCVSDETEKRPLMREVVAELQGVVECIWGPIWLPMRNRVSLCVHRCVRVWRRCVSKRVMTTKIVCKDHLVASGDDDCDNDGDLQLG